ncbi:predicted protein [Sparassis crispa]|uniref:Uncharacterized protein n=1 Tax=Sparassis crispa TaxID=139825 RepID=A0A401GC29_9APHY|nr:predicted protein [Sparassis crispa]GBE79683.1 predicted protein [Sparassis crispa]
MSVFSLFGALLIGQPEDASTWTIFVLWIVRIVSLSLIFRTYIGPSILSLISNRLRVRSVSLRSIRGIYFRAGTGTLRVDRVGISYHRPCAQSASRFSIKVEGMKLEITQEGPAAPESLPSLSSNIPSISAHLASFQLAPHIWSITRSVLSSLYTLLDPCLRPVIRRAIVTALRLVIRALPALTHILDFELHSAIVTLSTIPGVEFGLEDARFHTQVSLSSLESVVYPDENTDYRSQSRHRRFASVADWNARLTGSLRRTWDRAWGATLVSASISLQVKGVTGTARPLALKELCQEFYMVTQNFVDMPSVNFGLTVRVDPRRGIEPHSVETSLAVKTVDINADILRNLLNIMKADRSTEEEDATRENGLLSAISPPISSRAKWASPASPRSPFMGALSASMRFRWGGKQFAVRRLKTKSPTSQVSLLKSIDFRLSKLTLTHCLRRSPTDVTLTFKATMKHVALSAGLSHPDSNPMHREWLGKKSIPGDELSADVYRLNFFTAALTLDRVGSGALVDHLRVLSAGPLQLDTLVSRWPLPWLHGLNFLLGDPNAQLLVTNVSLGTVQCVERMEVLQALLKRKEPSKPRVDTGPMLPAILCPVPRVAIGFQVDEMCVRLISSSSKGDDVPFALELRSDGFLASAASNYSSITDNHQGHIPHDNLGLRMGLDLVSALKRTFVRVRFGPDMEQGHSDAAHIDYLGESLLSLEAVQLLGHASAIGDIGDESQSVALDVASIYTDLQCSTEALSVELWQPDVIRALSRIAADRGELQSETTPASPRRVLDKLPFGLSASFAIGRLIISVTGPDIAPDERLNISRGVVSQTGVSISYCAVRSRHTEQLRGLHAYNDKRLRLSLPTEQVVKAIAGTATPGKSHSFRALVQVAFWDAMLRDAVSTCFAADDPYCVGDQNADISAREFLRIKHTSIDVVLSGLRPNGFAFAGVKDDCSVTVGVSNVRGSMSLAQVYNLLLAVKTLNLFSAKSASTHSHRPPSLLSIQIRCSVNELQLLWEFPIRTKLFMRLTALHCFIPSEEKIDAKWRSIVFATSVPVDRDGIQKEEWEEVLRLSNWDVLLQPKVRPLAVSVDGDTGRLRIPFDFVLADLILDINVTIKSIKHLSRMISAGRYHRPPVPQAEEAKNVPNISIVVRCLTFEAADEDFEAQLGLIWRTGYDAAIVRKSRDDAFESKVATVLASGSDHVRSSTQDIGSDFQFSSERTVPIAEAHDRLLQVHSVAWRSAILKAKFSQMYKEEGLARRLSVDSQDALKGDLVNVKLPRPVPPLCRLTLDRLSLSMSSPSFASGNLADFLYDLGNGLPRDSQFSLLIPVHLDLSVRSLRFSFRDYPLPLLYIPPSSVEGMVGLHFGSHVVIAEEMGTKESVEWISCEVVKEHNGIHGASPLSILVPKTIMPVKTYANPHIRVTTDGVTDFSWAVSYGPAMQDFLRVLDTLSHAPRDPSPPIGIWDKLRLIFHWRIKVSFDEEVHFHMKGSRDPYMLDGHGAGFALCWRGDTRLLIGQPNKQGELIQVTSDSMLVVIPNIEDTYGSSSPARRNAQDTSAAPSKPQASKSRKYRKVCAKLSSGVRFGVGFVLERACGPECDRCTGTPFHRKCRMFHFLPHYDVKLEQKSVTPECKSNADSYNRFRSDFIHMSLSLTSALHNEQAANLDSSSIHLSPETFALFWAWYSLFDGAMSLPIRQGPRYARKRPVSPKFGQHLATLKYRFSVARFFISHLYVDNSRDAWLDGVTPYVGVKAMIDHFQADMHQRDQERSLNIPGGVQTVHHKVFNAIEVAMRGLELRTVLAIFSEQLKQYVPVDSPPLSSNYRTQTNLTAEDPGSLWLDLDDFDEIDKTPSNFYLLPTGSCPRFTYFKQVKDDDQSTSNESVERSKFGTEQTHVCFLGKEKSVTQVQMTLTSDRIQELQRKYDRQARQGRTNGKSSGNHQEDDASDTRRMIALLDDYVSHLCKVEAASTHLGPNGGQSYYMPSDSVSSEEWATFDHVYQVHCPQVFMDNTIRDILMQYYHCSRSRRGIDYHMATRAVKFIRDQAKAALIDILQEPESPRGAVSTAYAAAVAVRKLLIGEDGQDTAVDVPTRPNTDDPARLDPLDGWSEGVSLRKSHFCLLLKPQIVLRECSTDSVCVLAAVHGKLKSFDIMDDVNADDPVSGKVMSRNFASITGLQTFSPSAVNNSGEGCVPLEVLIDLRCENSAFDRLVPQTDASLQYDKFNRLRLRNNVTSVVRGHEQSSRDHLQNQTDLIRVHVPRFTVSANDRHFQAISSIVTNLLLFSDVAFKTRSDRLERMLFSYDFTNLESAADVVENMQMRLRHAMDTRREAGWKLRGTGEAGQVEMLKIQAHILLLAEELNLIFDGMKLAQDKLNDHPEQKSALLLHASSYEISWRMLDRRDQLLAKLAVRDINFYWLNRQDSSVVNDLSVGDLQAFDGAADAEWTEILCKHDEPATHPLVKRKLFLLADWTVLPPVGGITIYEAFELTFHPMRLQIDTRMGRKIMEYVWPARRNRKQLTDTQSLTPSPDTPSPATDISNIIITASSPASPRRSLSDMMPRKAMDGNKLGIAPLRKLGSSRSFTDLRKAESDTLRTPSLHKTRSIEALVTHPSSPISPTKTQTPKSAEDKDRIALLRKEIDDAAEMKTRSSQKTFAWVRVASLYLVLSIRKEDSFLCRDARIRTRDLEYRNQTWSFEELVDQFIPSDRNWRGWIKMAFQQPLVPVLPVAREIISKTKFIPSRSHHHHDDHGRMTTPKLRSLKSAGRESEEKKRSAVSLPPTPIVDPSLSSLTTEPETMPDSPSETTKRRPRVLSVFKRKGRGDSRSSMDSDISTTGTFSGCAPSHRSKDNSKRVDS